MRIRMTVLAAGLVAGALALGSSADAQNQIQLVDFHSMGANMVNVSAPPAAAGEMCYIIQTGQLVGAAALAPGSNPIPIANNGLENTLVADGPTLAARSTNWDDTPNEE